LPRRNFEEIRDKMLKSAKEGIKSAYQSEEYALIQAINAYLETSRSYNLNFERLSEWYGIYFPEVKMANPNTLASLVMVLNEGTMPELNVIEEAIKDAEKARHVREKALSTIGRSMNSDEAKAIIKFAKLSNEMASALDELDAYIKVGAERLMPNVTYLTEPKIAAELLSKAGSMERLATMPAGTVQLLGAEKALFKHIKFGSRPPKYGVLFKLPEIGTGQREIRGKIARAYATKICIALKADYFSKNFIAEKLKKDLQDNIKRIKEKPIVKGKEKKDFFRRDFRKDTKKGNYRNRRK
jgi:nucleolar protein 56